MYASFLVQKQHEQKRIKQEKDSMQFLMLFFFFFSQKNAMQNVRVNEA